MRRAPILISKKGCPRRLPDDTCAEVSLALVTPQGTASWWTDLGITLRWRLTGTALGAGLIDLGRGAGDRRGHRPPRRRQCAGSGGADTGRRRRQDHGPTAGRAAPRGDHRRASATPNSAANEPICRPKSSCNPTPRDRVAMPGTTCPASAPPLWPGLPMVQALKASGPGGGK